MVGSVRVKRNIHFCIFRVYLRSATSIPCLQKRQSLLFLILQLPPAVGDSEVVALTKLFSPQTLETVALRYFSLSEAEIGTFKARWRENIEGFKRELLHIFRNKGHCRKVRNLLYTFRNKGHYRKGRGLSYISRNKGHYRKKIFSE